MPRTRVELYQEEDGSVPLIEWLDDQPQLAQDKARARIHQLEAFGFELRRPTADFLRDGIYELRLRTGTIQHRMLYFFAGQGRALARRRAFERNPSLHTFRPSV
jgi:hypothetical protein